MKASVLVSDRKLEYKDIDSDEVKENDVRIDVKYTGICGSDVPRVLKHGAHFYPIVLGHEFSGEVTEVGNEVTSVKPGDHVVGIPLMPCFECEDCKKGNFSLCKHYSFVGSRRNGSYAEEIVLPENNVFKISNDIPFDKAVFFEPITVAYHAILQSKFEPNKTVAILGDGTIGLFALQILKCLGASKVVMFGRKEEKKNRALALGADAWICTTDEDFMKQAMDETDGKGFDYLYEAAGNTQTMLYMFELAANKSTACLIGTPTSNLELTPRLWENLNRKEFYLTGSWMSYSNPWPGVEWQEANKLLKNGDIQIPSDMVDKVFDLEDAMDAFDLFDKGEVKGKVLLRCKK